MILDASNGDQGTLYDADGVHIPYSVIADTETGWVTLLVLGANGKPQLNELKTEAVKETRQFKAPLTFVRAPVFSRTSDECQPDYVLPSR